MTFCVENETGAQFDFEPEEVAALVANEVLKSGGCDREAEISLTITNDEGIQELNREFREIDRATDVLSLPNGSYEEPGDFSVMEGEQEVDLLNPDTGNIMFGDIVVNEDRVRSQAQEYGHSTKREFAFLIAHSMLHLFGYDHETDEERIVMEEMQEKILNEKGITRDYV